MVRQLDEANVRLERTIRMLTDQVAKLTREVRIGFGRTPGPSKIRERRPYDKKFVAVPEPDLDPELGKSALRAARREVVEAELRRAQAVLDGTDDE